MPAAGGGLPPVPLLPGGRPCFYLSQPQAEEPWFFRSTSPNPSPYNRSAAGSSEASNPRSGLSSRDVSLHQTASETSGSRYSDSCRKSSTPSNNGSASHRGSTSAKGGQNPTQFLGKVERVEDRCWRAGNQRKTSACGQSDHMRVPHRPVPSHAVLPRRSSAGQLRPPRAPRRGSTRALLPDEDSSSSSSSCSCASGSCFSDSCRLTCPACVRSLRRHGAADSSATCCSGPHSSAAATATGGVKSSTASLSSISVRTIQGSVSTSHLHVRAAWLLWF